MAAGLLASGAALLILSSVTDSAVLAVAGAGCIVAVFVAREAWVWRGAGRQWLTMVGALAVIVLVAFVVAHLG